MPEAGYVYVLLNPSMEGFIKVGRTSRDPRERASELSTATGVPTPFFLAFFRFFNDSQGAEQYVHSFLERKGYRVTPNKEFFNAPLHEVVEAVLQAGGILNDEPSINSSTISDNESDLISSSRGDEFLDAVQIRSGGPGEAVLEEADAHYKGTGKTLQDYSEAMRLYKQAARLGAIRAYRSLGLMYAEGEGCVKDQGKALDFLKEGARKGDAICYAEMAKLFLKDGQGKNAQKCWDRFFNSAEVDTSDPHGIYCYEYFSKARQLGWLLEHLEHLKKAKDKMREYVERLIEIHQEMNAQSPAQSAYIDSVRQSILNMYQKNLEDILRTL